MDDVDELVRTSLIGLAVFGTLALGIGGFLTRVGGHWLDGGKLVALRQLGPLVWGEARLSGGKQAYLGLAFGGRVYLRRRDFGEEHLKGLGFTGQQTAWMEGHMTGSLHMRCLPDGMQGSFYGRRFSFNDQGISQVGKVEPVLRAWQAVAGRMT
jgi:hypothetical protein